MSELLFPMPPLVLLNMLGGRAGNEAGGQAVGMTSWA